MQNLAHMKTVTLQSRHSRSCAPCHLALLIPLVLAWFALAPQAHATCREGCDLTPGNTFLGDDALLNNTSGSLNTAIGGGALGLNTTGEGNVATGFEALFNNTVGGFNTANGLEALFSNTDGAFNTAEGSIALYSNTTATYNTAVGHAALTHNLTGPSNTAIGSLALYALKTGGANIAIGQKFPWTNYGSAVDIGTAQGDLITQVALANPHLRGIGFDLPEVAPVFEEYVEKNGLSDRVKLRPACPRLRYPFLKTR